MNWRQKFAVLLFAGLAALSGHAQTAGKYLAPRDQLIAIRAGRLFDAGSGMMLTNQVVIVSKRSHCGSPCGQNAGCIQLERCCGELSDESSRASRFHS